ncbi:sigma-70 family RNA polymerase sigma factor [Lysinibacillus telephonicus]|uniref:Sigma-70 family RNA polymerase sigma factor n=1 Tax=Lysinibacillus telephonicus TaxID=1714840 RepID=A0A431UPB2_9BACI|nr:sigma-70 family RNA polymerase sigma factor [Lysinibacillus telephonicus]RTQ91921.1 sigma-70 family RNA polymerase sigma factor [Lysinibacillus telephonicus]
MQNFEREKKAIDGDKSAFLELLEMYEDTHYRIAFSYFKNEYDALDAIQEFTYRSLKKLHTVKKPEYLSTWLIRVLLNVCHDMQKKKKRLELHESIEIGQHNDCSYLELSEAISKLSPEQQHLIYLKYFQDLKNEEIASEINIPEGTVKSRLHNALRKLRYFFGEGGQS